jgi:hypothetical protein
VLESPLWMEAKKYPARLDRQLLAALFTEGVHVPANGGLKVAPRAAGANMSVDVAAGLAGVTGDNAAGQGLYLCKSTAVENLPIAPAPGSDSRIDLVIARVLDGTVTGGVSHEWVLEVLTGTVAAAPVAPAVPASAIPLGEVLVAAGTTSIGAAKITGRRSAATLPLGDSLYFAKPTRLWLPATRFAAGVGAPVLDRVNSWPVWLFDAAAEESVAATFGAPEMPADWLSYTVDIWWTNPAASTGNVTWSLGTSIPRGEGDVVNVSLNTTSIHSQAGQGVLVRSSVSSGAIAAPTTDDDPLGFLRLRRLGADASDTLGNDAALVGLRLHKVS